MRRLSLARAVQVALLGLTLALTVIAAIGVAALYGSRQDYEEQLATALGVQAGAARLQAAGVTEEAALREAPDDASASAGARAAFEAELARLRPVVAADPPSAALLARAAAEQQRARRAAPGAGAAPAPRRALLALEARQTTRITQARERADRHDRRAVVAITLSGGLALLAALALVAGIVAAVRRPLDGLVRAAGLLAAGDGTIRVTEDGPRELRDLAVAFNTMARDVQSATARVEAERRRLATTVQALGDALVISRADGTVEQANPRAAELVPELRPGAPMVPPAPLELALRQEVQVERDDRTLAVTAAPLEADTGHVWTIRDVTERARLERLKSDFVATASHELRSPLTSIKGFVELLEASRGLTPRQQEWIEIVHVSSDRLVELVEDLLDVTRLEAGQVEIQRRPTDVGELVREVGRLLSPRLDAADQHFTADVPDDLPRALVDPGRLRQVLVNLLTNAHLYMGEGGALGVTVEGDGQALVLRVWDTGRGMTPEQLAHVFDRFYRAAEPHGPQGTGLGLSIVRSIVDLHRGTVEVDSAPGEGTTFTVRLPRALELDGGAGGTAREALRGRSVLVVDDEPSVAALVAEHLQDLGMRPTPVHSGPEALAALRATRFDAMTLDVLMPGMTGFEVLRAVRADPALAGVPVVVVSVFSGRDALHGEWTVTKPIQPGDLADALGAAVLAGRIHVLAVGEPGARAGLDEALDGLGIAHEWATDADEVAAMCAARHYEVALVDAGREDADAVLGALDLRGRRLRRAVLAFSPDGPAPLEAPLGADPVALADAGAAVLGRLAASAGDPAG